MDGPVLVVRAAGVAGPEVELALGPGPRVLVQIVEADVARALAAVIQAQEPGLPRLRRGGQIGGEAPDEQALEPVLEGVARLRLGLRELLAGGVGVADELDELPGRGADAPLQHGLGVRPLASPRRAVLAHLGSPSRR